MSTIGYPNSSLPRYEASSPAPPQYSPPYYIDPPPQYEAIKGQHTQHQVVAVAVVFSDLPCPAPIQPALLHRSAPTVRGYQGAAYSISGRCCCCWSKTVHPTIEMDSFCYCCCCCIWYCRCYRSLLSCYNAMFTEVIIFVIQDYRSCRLGQRWYVHCPVLRPPRLYQVTRHEKEVSYGWAQYILVLFQTPVDIQHRVLVILVLVIMLLTRY